MFYFAHCLAFLLNENVEEIILEVTAHWVAGSCLYISKTLLKISVKIRSGRTVEHLGFTFWVAICKILFN